jgi:L-alanine-DL-glutamate epimerase-like enolase superfamily enzyme
MLAAQRALDITRNISGQYPNLLPQPPGVPVNATIAAEDPATVTEQVTATRGEGFRCVKIKVPLGDDSARLAAARSAGGEDMAIRIDANGAWSFDDEIARVAAASRIPIALDETAAVPGAFERRVCDAACLKVARSGGLTGLLQSAAQARTAGYRIYLASTLDGPLAIAAALHAAVAIEPELLCGLATLGVFADRADPLPARGGRISVPFGPGLGDGLREWYGLHAA